MLSFFNKNLNLEIKTRVVKLVNKKLLIFPFLITGKILTGKNLKLKKTMKKDGRLKSLGRLKKLAEFETP